MHFHSRYLSEDFSQMLVITQRSPCPSEAYGGGWEDLGKEGLDCALQVTSHLTLCHGNGKASPTYLLFANSQKEL